MVCSTMSLLFCEQTHLCEFGENFGGGAAIAKSLFITFSSGDGSSATKI